MASKRWRAKPGWDEPASRSCKAEPKYLLLLFGLSFERQPDIVRIDAILKCEPEAKVLSVSLHPCPQKDEMRVLGELLKYYPERYEHVETNFREERGLKTLMERVHVLNLPAKGYLDYAWLQTNYYKERPQGYGMNWLPTKTDGKNTWTIGKIKMLMEVGMTEFFLPMDVGGNAKEMVEAYVKACCGPHRKTATKLLLRPLEMGKVRKGCKEHRLVNSDFECASRLNLLQRDPGTQINKFLDKIVPFYIVTELPAALDTNTNNLKKRSGCCTANEKEQLEALLKPQWPPQMPRELETAILKKIEAKKSGAFSSSSYSTATATASKRVLKNSKAAARQNFVGDERSGKSCAVAQTEKKNNNQNKITKKRPSNNLLPDIFLECMCPILTCQHIFSDKEKMREHFSKSHKPYFRCLEVLEAAQQSQKGGSSSSSRAATRIKQAEQNLEEAKEKMEAGLYGSELLDGIRGAKPGEFPIYVCGNAESNTCSNPRHRPVQMLNAKGKVVAEFCSGTHCANGIWCENQDGENEFQFSPSEISASINGGTTHTRLGVSFAAKYEGETNGKAVLLLKGPKGPVKKEFQSASDAARQLGLKNSGSIGQVCNGNKESTSGHYFRWKYESATKVLHGRSFRDVKEKVVERLRAANLALQKQPPPVGVCSVSSSSHSASFTNSLAATTSSSAPPVKLTAKPAAKFSKAFSAKRSVKRPLPENDGQFVAEVQEPVKYAMVERYPRRTNVLCVGVGCACKSAGQNFAIELFKKLESSSSSTIPTVLSQSSMLPPPRDDRGALLSQHFCCIPVASMVCGMSMMDISDVLHGRISNFGQPEDKSLRFVAVAAATESSEPATVEAPVSSASSFDSSSSSSSSSSLFQLRPATGYADHSTLQKIRSVVHLNEYNEVVAEYTSAKAAAQFLCAQEQDIIESCNDCFLLPQTDMHFRWKEGACGASTVTSSGGAPSSSSSASSSSSSSGVSSWDFSREVSTLTPSEYSEQPQGVFNKEFEENDAVLAQVGELYKKLWARKTAMMQTFVQRIESDDDKMRYYEKTNFEIFEVRNTLKTGSSKMGKFVGKDLLKRKKEEKVKEKIETATASNLIDMSVAPSNPRPLLLSPQPPPPPQQQQQQQQQPQPQPQPQPLQQAQTLQHQDQHHQVHPHNPWSQLQPGRSPKQSKMPQSQQQPWSQYQHQHPWLQSFPYGQAPYHRLQQAMQSSDIQKGTEQRMVAAARNNRGNLSRATVQGSALGGSFPWASDAVASSSVASSSAMLLPARLPGKSWLSVPATYQYNQHPTIAARHGGPAHLYAEAPGVQRTQKGATRQNGVAFENPVSAAPTDQLLASSHQAIGMNALYEPSQCTYLASVACMAPLSQHVASSTAPLYATPLSASERDAQAQRAQFRAKMTGATEKMNGVMNVQREWEQENLQGSIKALPSKN